MEPTLDTTAPEGVETAPACLKCGSFQILDGYANPLCAHCRTSLIKYPVPLGIKLFGAGMVALLIIALALSVDNFKAAFAYARAKRAETSKNYLTEERELETVMKVAPGSTEALAHMMIASFYNGDLTTYSQLLNKITGKSFDNEELLSQVNDLTNEIEANYISEALTKAVAPYQKALGGVPNTTYQNYIRKQPGDVYARIVYASACIEKNKNARADSLLKGALAIAPNHISALMLRSITLRELNRLDSSIYMCDKLLAQNHESDMAMSSKARTLFKKRDKKAGLQLALQAEALNTNLPYNKVTLAIAYHLNNNTKARDALLKMSEADSTLAEGMTYAKDIISGKIKFAN
jgi:predicted Zn-dependent protease